MIIINQSEDATTEDLSLKIFNLKENEYAIYDKYVIWLGTYKTEERAKEVLQQIIGFYIRTQDENKVFRMPKE